MEAVTGHAADRVAVATAVARGVVQVSTLLAVATGCWLLWLVQPAHAATCAVVFGAAALLARWRIDYAAGLVLLFAYTSGGILIAAPSLPATLLWLAALAGLVAGGCGWTHWSAPREWRWPLMLWLLGVAISWPIIAAREADFAGPVAGDGVGIIVTAALAGLSTGLWLDAALAWDVATIERRVARPLLTSLVVASAAVFYQAFVDITWLSGEPWIQLRRPPGLMGDANPMAVAAALWAPLAPFVLRRRIGLAGGFAVTSLLWYCAWLTGARSVLLLAGAGALGLLAGFMASRMSPRRALAGVAIAALAGALILVGLSRLPIGGPLARLTHTLPLDRPAALAYEVLWRRDGYGLAAARAIRELPWSGVGHGAFNFLASHYWRLEGGPPVPPDNAQNLWRHTLAERGLLAFPAVLAMTVATIRLLARPAAAIPVQYLWTLKAMVMGLGCALVFGLPTQNAAIALTAATLIAWLHAAVSARAVDRAPLGPIAVVSVWGLALIGLAVDARHARDDLRPPARVARLGDLYVRGFGDVETGPRGASGRVVTRHGVATLGIDGSQYRLRLWVRGTDARHVKVWQDRRLVMDELLPAGVLIERVLEAPAAAGMMLEFETDEPGIVVTGEFSGASPR